MEEPILENKHFLHGNYWCIPFLSVSNSCVCFKTSKTHDSILDSSRRMKQPFGDVLLSKVSIFMKKYFLEGQKLDEKQKHALETLPSDAPWTKRMLVRHRRLIGILIPLCFFELFWWMQVR